MVKSTDISVSDQNGVNVTVSGNDINVTKTADTGSFKLAVKVVDEWGREYNKEYTINVINIVIPVTSLELTVDGNAVTDGKYTASAGGRYSKFTGVTVGYIPTPADANSITSVEYTSSNTLRLKVNPTTGLVELTNLAKTQATNTATITCTVTNLDGTTASASVVVTITKA